MTSDSNVVSKHQILAADGTSSIPSISFASDMDTGMYRSSGDTLTLATGGNDVLRLTSNRDAVVTNNMGIGITNPLTDVHVDRDGSGEATTDPVGNLHFTHPTSNGYSTLSFGSTVNNTDEGSDGAAIYYFDTLHQYNSIFGGTNDEQSMLALYVGDDNRTVPTVDSILLNATGAVFVDGGVQNGTVGPNGNNPHNNAAMYILGSLQTGTINWDGSTSSFTKRNSLDNGSGDAEISGTLYNKSIVFNDSASEIHKIELSSNSDALDFYSDNFIRMFESDNTTQAFHFNVNTQRQGIGTSSPSEALHVIGNILASGDVTAESDERIKRDVVIIEDAMQKIRSKMLLPTPPSLHRKDRKCMGKQRRNT